MEQVGESMTWRESALLMRILVRDTTSWMGSVMVDWKYPLSYEGQVAAYHADNFVAANTDKKSPKPLPRPWDSRGKRIGAKTHLAQKDVRAFLDWNSRRKGES